MKGQELLPIVIILAGFIIAVGIYSITFTPALTTFLNITETGEGGNVSAENVRNGTFGANQTNGIYTFPDDVRVDALVGTDDNLSLFSNGTHSDSRMTLFEHTQQFGDNIETVQFLNTRVNFTGLADTMVLQFEPTAVNIFRPELELVAEGATFTEEKNLIRIEEPIILDFLNPTITGVKFTSNITYEEPGFVFGAMTLLGNLVNAKNPPGEANDLGALFAFFNGQRFTADGQTITSNLGVGFFDTPTIATISGGDMTVATIQSLRSVPNMPSADGTITTRQAVFIGDKIGAGSITNSIGIRIDDLSGTNQFGIQQDGATDQNYFDGNSGFGGCHDSDHDLKIGGTSTNCDTGTWSEIDAGQATFTISSSSLIKENFAPVSSVNILEKVKGVEVFTYDFKAYNATEQVWNETSASFDNITFEIPAKLDRMGVKAEEFNTIFNRNDGTMLSGDELIYALWLSVQALTTENEGLEARIKALETP